MNFDSVAGFGPFKMCSFTKRYNSDNGTTEDDEKMKKSKEDIFFEYTYLFK